MKRLQLLILSVTTVLFSCERDDICAATTSTTPRLIVEFYDIINTEELKSVTRLTVYGEDLLLEPPTSETVETLVFNSNVNRIELPLLIGEENVSTTTRYIFEKDTNRRLDENNPQNSNVDILEIRYTPEFIYVSRACGYKSQFIGLSSIVESDDEVWINNIEIVEPTVNNENTVHVRLFH
ncbi:DUF6452 family protein [Winogradskyella alexanderae]|uniref:Lipoprotein n=1 Tax=Winogradskyella alexanderae TaxID=2877123 RepID=A0ABS7XNV4_9FLAO|nr:DUF6452 family protein [Winogradskyella alexanderae]MCA0131671.1 hypothetical protein [Winogradskyella alexanderae]